MQETNKACAEFSIAWKNAGRNDEGPGHRACKMDARADTSKAEASCGTERHINLYRSQQAAVGIEKPGRNAPSKSVH